MEIQKLDNSVWNSLNETHQLFAINYENEAKFYDPKYCPFGGLNDDINIEDAINNYTLLTNNFFVVGEKPIFSNKVQLKNELICNQMILNQPIDIEISEQIIELKTPKQKIDLIEIVNLVQPGYFMNNTPDMGSYYGIYKNDKLIAVTGERMKMNEYTEVSAVITHPEHTGKGYAKQLTSYTSNKIFEENKTPYLHVAVSNIGAIKLYEKLGFVTRKKISFWNFARNNDYIATNG